MPNFRASKILDASLLDELIQVMGDDFPTLLSTFLSDCETKLDLLKTAVTEKDFDAIRRIAHSLKGSSRNLGAIKMASECELLEISARSNELFNPELTYQTIYTAFSEAAQELRQF